MALDKKDWEQLDRRFEKQKKEVAAEVTKAVVPEVTKAVVPEVTKAVVPEVVKAVIPEVKSIVRLVISEELTEQEEKYEKKLDEFKSEFYERIDLVLKEVMANREERTIMAHYISELRDRVEKIEKQLGMTTST